MKEKIREVHRYERCVTPGAIRPSLHSPASRFVVGISASHPAEGKPQLHFKSRGVMDTKDPNGNVCRRGPVIAIHRRAAWPALAPVSDHHDGDAGISLMAGMNRLAQWQGAGCVGNRTDLRRKLGPLRNVEISNNADVENTLHPASRPEVVNFIQT